MEGNKVLEVVLREMDAYALGWRMDWSYFDGRTLRNQLTNLSEWARRSLYSREEDFNYTEGTDFLKVQGGGR